MHVLVQCALGYPPVHMHCNEEPPLVLLFDDVLLVCNYEDQVDCGDRPIIDGPTGTTTTTSATTITTTGSTITTTVTTTSDTTIGTTTEIATTTTSAGQHIQRFPEKVMGFYILLADDTGVGFEADSDWEPQLYDYLVEAGNVLFFSFINPDTMIVPNAYKKLMDTKGSGGSGTIPADTSKRNFPYKTNYYCLLH